MVIKHSVELQVSQNLIKEKLSLKINEICFISKTQSSHYNDRNFYLLASDDVNHYDVGLIDCRSHEG